jgi:hypothetical protein
VAGFPRTNVFGAMLANTTLPAETMAPEPTSTPGAIKLAAASQTPLTNSTPRPRPATPAVTYRVQQRTPSSALLRLSAILSSRVREALVGTIMGGLLLIAAVLVVPVQSYRCPTGRPVEGSRFALGRPSQVQVADLGFAHGFVFFLPSVFGSYRYFNEQSYDSLSSFLA